VELVGYDWLEERLGSPGLQVADPRLRVRYTSGHIQGALHVPVAKAFGPGGALLPAEVLAAWFSRCGIATELPVLVYDQPDGQAGATLAWLLEYLGHREVYFLNESFAQWASTGRQVFYRPISPEPAEFVVEVRPELRAGWSDVAAGSGVDVVDARSEEEFRGEVAVRDDPPGHIPKARNVPWLKLLDGAQRLFVAKDLSTGVFLEAGLARDRRAIVYCRSGPRAAVVTLLMRQAGFGASLYDGSWVDWARRGAPIEPAHRHPGS